MTLALSLLCQVIQRRVARGEALEAILADYPKLTEAEQEAIIAAAGEMYDMLPCTACRYCTSHCPQELDIPEFMFMYNELKLQNGFITSMGIGALPKEKRPSACIGCRSCEAVCPQQIKIADIMEDFVARMQGPVSW